MIDKIKLSQALRLWFCLDKIRINFKNILSIILYFLFNRRNTINLRAKFKNIDAYEYIVDIYHIELTQALGLCYVRLLILFFLVYKSQNALQKRKMVLRNQDISY